MGLPGSSDGKESACNVGDLNLIWVGKIPWRRAWQPTPVFLPEESPWTEGPGRLQSMGSQRARLDRATKHSTAQSYFINTTFPSSQVKNFKANPRHIISPINMSIHDVRDKNTFFDINMVPF